MKPYLDSLNSLADFLRAFVAEGNLGTASKGQILAWAKDVERARNHFRNRDSEPDEEHVGELVEIPAEFQRLEIASRLLAADVLQRVDLNRVPDDVDGGVDRRVCRNALKWADLLLTVAGENDAPQATREGDSAAAADSQ